MRVMLRKYKMYIENYDSLIKVLEGLFEEVAGAILR